MGAFCVLLSPEVALARTYSVNPAGGADYQDLAVAVEACADGDILLLAPGIYYTPDGGISLQGKSITITSSGGPEVTELNAAFFDHIFILDSGEVEDTVIEGLSIRAASSSAVVLDGTRPTMRNLIFDYNTTIGNTLGVAMQLSNQAAPTLTDVIFTSQTSQGSGTISALDSALVMERVRFENNYALGYGGALYLQNSSAEITDGEFVSNNGTGGTIALQAQSRLTLTRATFIDNVGQLTPGILLQDSRMDAANLLASGHYGAQRGFVRCENSDVTLTHSTLVGNAAVEGGAAFYGLDCNASFQNSIFAFNKAAKGGAVLAVSSASPTSSSSQSNGAAAEEPTPTATPVPEPRNRYSFSSCNLFQNGPEPVVGTDLPGLDNVTLDPRFQAFSDDLIGQNDDYHLLPGSPLRDLAPADIAFNDPDGSRGDLGATGGPAADVSWDQDSDGDGLPDGWELQWFAGLDAQSGSLDADEDGLTNLSEYVQGLTPTDPDTDGDGLTDADELSAGSSARDAFSPNQSQTLPFGRITSLQAAIDAGKDDITIIAPRGDYPEAIDFKGKSITLKAQDGTEFTTLSPPLGLRGVTFQLGEDSHAALQGFTIQGADTELPGAGLWVFNASPVLRELALLNNYSSTSGGGMALVNTTLAVSDISFIGNAVAEEGGGLYAENADISLSRVSFQGNLATTAGGAIAALQSVVTVSEALFEANAYTGFAAVDSTLRLDRANFVGNSGSTGGALLASHCDVTITQCQFEANVGTDGGALGALASSLSLTQVSFTSNLASTSAGALYASYDVTGTLDTVLLQDNQAPFAGGLLLEDTGEGLPPELSIEHASIVGNTGSRGAGALALTGAANLSVQNSLITHNVSGAGQSVALDPTSTLTLSYSFVSQNRPDNGLPSELLLDNVSALDPAYVQFVDDLKADGDDLHLQPSSPARNASAPGSAPDPDGTAADLGYYGGPNADFSYYQDLDFDGMADGWETSQGLDTTQNDATLDPDGDGLNNLAEAQANTNPTAADTDGDGLSDSAEVSAGTSPTSAFDPPGLVTVPEVFARIQDAIDAAPPGGAISVKAGTYAENLNLLGKPLQLVGAGIGSSILDGQSDGPVLYAGLGETSETRVSGFTLRNGRSLYGGGLEILDAAPHFQNLLITSNYAELYGGGIYVRGDATFTDVLVTANLPSEGLRGGGIAVLGGSPTFTRAQVLGNVAQNGGGCQVDGGSPTFINSSFLGNQGALGGGLGLNGTDASAELINCTVHANAAGGGAGILNDLGAVTLHNSQVTGNTGPTGAGLMSRNNGVYTLRFSNIWSNHGSNFSDGIPDVIGVDGNTSEDPRYFTFSDDGVWSNDDLHLRPDSPLANAGDPDILNPDGSRAEPGVYGGPEADRSYYADADRDQLYDGWETAFGLNPQTNDSALDPDSDTLSNLQEFEHGTHPQKADTDGDAISDDEELRTGSDPTDLFSPVDTVVVNDLFPSLQEAINQARDGVTLQVKEGLYQEQLDFRGKAIKMVSLGEARLTTLDGNGIGPVVAFRSGESRETVLEGFTITNGSAQDGGGVRVAQSDPTLLRLIVRNNTATNSGGGLSVSYADPLMANLLIYGNSARDGAGIGGRAATMELYNSTVASNTAAKGGGGLTCIDLCSITLLNNIFAYNVADQGGGVNIIVPGVLTFENNNVYGNLAENYGGIPDQSGRKGNISLDPRFVAPSISSPTPDFGLQSDSPCLDAGDDLSELFPPEDLNQVPRPFDANQDGASAYDLGALEFEYDVDGDQYLVSDGDCVEGDISIHPQAPEVCDDGIDQDCDGVDLSCQDVDNDQDGFTEHQGDCNDADTAVRPDATEVQDGIDNNCDGTVDEGFDTPTPTPDPGADGCACTQAGEREGSSPRLPLPHLGLALLVLWRLCRRPTSRLL